MKRGELWTVLGESPYANKPRPVLIVQSDDVSGLDSTILCLVTSSVGANEDYRVLVEPSDTNGLRRQSWIMVDKLYSARVDMMGERIGVLADEEMNEVSIKIAILLGL